MFDLRMVPEVREWLHQLRITDKETLTSVSQAITALRIGGPSLGRPLIDTIVGSKLGNLKELRPGSSGSSEVRILFVFDPTRNAVLLVAGDKSGRWKRWYEAAIPLAEERYEAYLKEVRS